VLTLAKFLPGNQDFIIAPLLPLFCTSWNVDFKLDGSGD
jgi:hypothetical protein